MRVLIAEDDRVTRRLLESRLTKWGYDVLAVEDGLQAWEVLQQEDSPRFVLLDWIMPGMDGIDVCRKIRDGLAGAYRYVIILTGKDGLEDVVSGLEAGADDYLTKPVVQQELKVRMNAGSRILNLQDELLEAQDALRFQATHDSLTAVWNRGAVMDMLDREISRAHRQNSHLAVVLADIDHFKLVNDTHGHPIGDEVLKEVVRRLQISVRKYDSVGRYGGEEFLLLVPGCTREDALAHTERLRCEVADSLIFVNDDLQLRVTVSMGVATYDGAEVVEPAHLINVADRALYQAKENGRNRIELVEG